MSKFLGALGAFFLFAALTRPADTQSGGRVFAGLSGLFLTSMTIMIVAVITGFGLVHPMITGGGLLLINFLGAANLVRQANPGSGLLARALGGGIGTYLISGASSYAAGIVLGLLVVALHAIR
jgi:hypothetical protein